MMFFSLIFSAIQAQSVLDYKTGDLAPPAQISLYYNNREVNGYVIMSDKEPFILADSIKSLFNFNDDLNDDTKRYMVNGYAVDTYYYGNNLYLDLIDFADALGLVPKITSDGKGVIFISKSASQYTPPPYETPPVRVSVNNKTSGYNSDPINNNSYIYNVSLTNTSQSNIAVNHFNFLLIGSSGHVYVSVKNIAYDSIYWSNGTPDTIILSPSTTYNLNLTFDLPENDSPKQLVIVKNQKTIGITDL